MIKRALLGLLLLPAAVPPSSAAQTLLGNVLAEGAQTPVTDVTVSLLDREGNRRAATSSDSLGRFTLTPPESGEYVVHAERLGYLSTRSPLFAMSREGSVPFEIMLSLMPIGLEGLEVSVEAEAEELLGLYGLSPTLLGQRWIDRRAIEESPAGLEPAQVIRWRAMPGVQVLRRGAIPQLCVMFAPWRTCAEVYFNGARISQEDAAQIDPNALEAIAVLKPNEATIFFGTGAGNGVVLLWPRTVRR